MKQVSELKDIKIKQPVRKVWRFKSNNTLLVSIPKELGIKEGDLLLWKVVDGQIIVRKVEEGDLEEDS